MVYEFSSRATGNMVMTQAVAERLLQVIGKSPGAQGIITVAEMPAAIAKLKAAMAADKADKADKAGPAGGSAAEDEDDQDKEKAIGLSQRAFPMVEMLERALAGDKDITWGV